ncbi:DMT family transporter [Shinella daejeonensis]|uniref:DMT family transporter n=1 Tax=Shinella daejeonensis TaxID=659017 RepID=UPI003F5CE1B9
MAARRAGDLPMNMTTVYAILIVAIVFEVLGTSAMQAAQHFTRLVPTITMIVCYGVAFFFLSWSLRYVPVGIAYAIWSGLGIVLISLVGVFVFGQKLDLAAMLGLGLIIAGVLVLNLFSKSTFH